MSTDDKLEKLTKELAREIKTTIDYEVSIKADDYKHKFEGLVFDLESLITDNELIVDDYKEQGLTFSTIEAEGFQRAMLTIRNIIDNNK